MKPPDDDPVIAFGGILGASFVLAALILISFVIGLSIGWGARCV